VAIAEVHVEGYRSLRDVHARFGRLTVVVGANGSGKTNLYRALHLLHAAARGNLARTIADEGGMPSAVWAGARTKGPVRLTIGVVIDTLRYELSLGLPSPTFGFPTLFTLDPLVKEETIVALGERKRGKRGDVTLLSRGNLSVWVRDLEGARVDHPMTLRDNESVLGQLAEPHRYPELSRLRTELEAWRFYHHFRTDEGAPARHPQVGVRTTMLAHDGSDLAAALATIREIGDDSALAAAIDRAFPGATLDIEAPEGRFSLALRLPGMHRPLAARELSDGTLRYLCLLAALMSPRAPPLLALNEPETSLHPDLIAPLAELVIDASTRSQVWVTTHAEALASAIAAKSDVAPIRLAKREGATVIERMAEPDDDE
jgi:predicted ATPase